MRDSTSGTGVLLHRLDDLLQRGQVHRIRNIFDLLHRFHGGPLMVFTCNACL